MLNGHIAWIKPGKAAKRMCVSSAKYGGILSRCGWCSRVLVVGYWRNRAGGRVLVKRYPRDLPVTETLFFKWKPVFCHAGGLPPMQIEVNRDSSTIWLDGELYIVQCTLYTITLYRITM